MDIVRWPVPYQAAYENLDYTDPLYIISGNFNFQLRIYVSGLSGPLKQNEFWNKASFWPVLSFLRFSSLLELILYVFFIYAQCPFYLMKTADLTFIILGLYILCLWVYRYFLKSYQLMNHSWSSCIWRLGIKNQLGYLIPCIVVGMKTKL